MSETSLTKCSAEIRVRCLFLDGEAAPKTGRIGRLS